MLRKSARRNKPRKSYIPNDENLPTARKGVKSAVPSFPRAVLKTIPENSSDLLPSIFAAFVTAETEKNLCVTLDKHMISPGTRSRMVDWMVEVISAFSMSLETLFISVRLMDYFLMKTEKRFRDGDVHLIGMTCMLIGSKFVEVDPFHLNAMVELVGKKKFSSTELRQMELEILETVEYTLCFVTPLQVVEYICVALGLPETVKRSAEILLVINQMAILVQQATPSHQAVTALVLALSSLGRPETVPLVLPFAQGKEVGKLAALMHSNVFMYKHENPNSGLCKHLKFAFSEVPGGLFSFQSEGISPGFVSSRL